MKPQDNFEQILWKSLNQRWKISGIFLNNFRVFSTIIPDFKKQKNKKNYDKYTQAYHILVIPWLTCKGLDRLYTSMRCTCIYVYDNIQPLNFAKKQLCKEILGPQNCKI